MRLEEASKDPEVAKVLLGDDMNALQELLRAYHLAEKRRRADMAHRSTDAQRVSATVPRWVVRQSSIPLNLLLAFSRGAQCLRCAAD